MSFSQADKNIGIILLCCPPPSDEEVACRIRMIAIHMMSVDLVYKNEK